MFGRQVDLLELLAKAKEHELKVILDFVPNHSSDQHIWFQQSLNRQNGFDDFFIWRNCNQFVGGVRQPVNNWVNSDLHSHTHIFLIAAITAFYLLIRFPNTTIQCGPTVKNAINVIFINSPLVSPTSIIVLITITSLKRSSSLSLIGWMWV